MWLSVWVEVQVVCILSSYCHCHPQTPSSLASFRSRLVLPFWSQLTQVVLVKETVVLNQASKLVLRWFLQLFVAARFCIVCVQL